MNLRLPSDPILAGQVESFWPDHEVRTAERLKGRAKRRGG
jgi:hypothetical protein